MITKAIKRAAKRLAETIKNKRIRLAVLGSVMMFLIAMGGVLQAQDVARGYATKDKELKPGMVAALGRDSSADKPEVERADLDSASRVIGVTVNSSDSLVTIASGADQVYVQSKGEVSVYATDLNGEIRKGDGVAVSPLKGSVMRAAGNIPQLGISLEDFPAVAQEAPIEGSYSGRSSVRTARLRVTLASGLSESTSARESSLSRLGRAITGKHVGEIQVIIALIIFLVVMVAEGSIIYGAITSAITALGRNPLAKKVIISELVRVLGMVIAVFIVGMSAIYLVLKV